MILRILRTEDERQRSFELERPVSVRKRTYTSSIEAMESPVASKIFGFPWAESVTVAPKSITVSKQDWVSWDVLEDPLRELLIEHFREAKGVEENPVSVKKETTCQMDDGAFKAKEGSLDSQEAETIKSLIDSEINPALASHGGFVILHSVEGDRAFIEMGGGCQGCAMSYMTLKEGIEEAIKQAVPAITTVVDVTDHDHGENPYYS